jgi:hypothetical protein
MKGPRHIGTSKRLLTAFVIIGVASLVIILAVWYRQHVLDESIKAAKALGDAVDKLF